MHDTLTGVGSRTVQASAGGRALPGAGSEFGGVDPSPRDRAFIALQSAYRPHGGISRSHCLAVGGASVSDRARRIDELVDDHQLFRFQWHHDWWLPMFQLDKSGPSLATAPRRVIAELGDAFDGWAMAIWFVQPNSWLEGHSPIERLEANLPDVLAAARADRFVATA